MKKGRKHMLRPFPHFPAKGLFRLLLIVRRDRALVAFRPVRRILRRCRLGVVATATTGPAVFAGAATLTVMVPAAIATAFVMAPALAFAPAAAEGPASAVAAMAPAHARRQIAHQRLQDFLLLIRQRGVERLEGERERLHALGAVAHRLAHALEASDKSGFLPSARSFWRSSRVLPDLARLSARALNVLRNSVSTVQLNFSLVAVELQRRTRHRELALVEALPGFGTYAVPAALIIVLAMATPAGIATAAARAASAPRDNFIINVSPYGGAARTSLEVEGSFVRRRQWQERPDATFPSLISQDQRARPIATAHRPENADLSNDSAYGGLADWPHFGVYLAAPRSSFGDFAASPTLRWSPFWF